MTKPIGKSLCGFRPKGSDTPRHGTRAGMATFAQLTGWVLKYHKVSCLRFLTLDGARKVITGLKAWKSRAA